MVDYKLSRSNTGVYHLHYAARVTACHGHLYTKPLGKFSLREAGTSNPETWCAKCFPCGKPETIKEQYNISEV